MDNSKKMNEIVTRIKKRREELKLSYQDLADRTGFGKSTLQRYETGSIRTMPIDRFEQLAKALEIEPYKLMGWDVDDILSYDNEYEDDADIIDLYRNYNKLDENGKKKLLEYSFDLVYTKKYTKNVLTESVETIANKSNQYSNNSNINTNNINTNNSNTDNSNFDDHTSLEKNFITIAAHDDGLEEDKIKEMDSIFFNKILEKNKKNK